MTLGKCSNHHIRPRFRSDWGQDTSDSGCLRRKRCDTNWREDIVRFSWNEPWKQVPKQEFIIKTKGRMKRWLMNSTMIHWDFQKMDFHTYVNKESTFVGPNDIRKYARGKHTQLNIGWKVRPKCGLGCTTNVRMVIQLAKDLEWTIDH